VKNIQSYVLAAAVLLLMAHPLSAADSAGSLAFSGSYSLRASGCEANYWNPANLVYPMPYKIEIMLINSSFMLENSIFSIRRYNEINGTYLTDSDKRKIIKDLDKNLSLKTTAAHNIAGISFDNLALSSRVHLFGTGKLSARYIELILLGNEYDEVYHFGNKNNDFKALGYIDLTAGASLYSFQLRDYLIHTGAALSLLGGIAGINVEDYNGSLLANDEGVHLDQKIVVKSGMTGYGFKSLIGLRSDIDENLSLGLALDNLGGFIYWTGQTERRYYTALIDSLYVSKLDEDVLESTETVEEIGSFTTILPAFIRLSALYRLESVNFSLDWKQGFVNSVVTSKTPEISMGTEYYVIPQIPLRMGFSPGLGDNLYSLSYGLGYNIERFEINLGLKTSGSLVPGSYSKGVALALTSKLRI
jgi:hypothetical protein